MPARRLPPALLVLAALPAAAGAPPAPPAPAVPSAAPTVAALAAREARAPHGRLTLRVTDRRADLSGPLDDAARAQVAAAPGGSAEGTLAYRPEGWLKDLRPPGEPAPGRTLRTRTAEAAGVLRTLLEVTGADGRPELHARVLRVSLTAPADALLTRRAAPLLQALQWTAERREGDGLVLEGRRPGEQHTLTVTPGPEPRIKKWVLLRRLTSPEGQPFEQRYECEVEPAGEGRSERVDEWITAAAGARSVTFRRTEVRATDTGGEPPDVHLRFPAGTHVLDVRNEVPVEYEQTTDGIDDADVNEAAKALAQGRTRAGQPAPDFFFQGPRGGPLKLTDLSGNTVVLFWFSSASEPARAAAPGLRALAEKYRKRRVRVIGLLVGDAGEPGSRAEGFRKEFRWDFPVFVDTQGEALHRFGLVAAVPKIAVVDPRGTLAYAEPGADLAAVTTLLERLADRR